MGLHQPTTRMRRTFASLGLLLAVAALGLTGCTTDCIYEITEDDDGNEFCGRFCPLEDDNGNIRTDSSGDVIYGDPEEVHMVNCRYSSGTAATTATPTATATATPTPTPSATPTPTSIFDF